MERRSAPFLNGCPCDCRGPDKHEQDTASGELSKRGHTMSTLYRKMMGWFIALMLMVSATVVLSGCERESGPERAGEEIGEAVEEAGEAAEEAAEDVSRG